MMYTAHVASGSILNQNFVITNARPLAQSFGPGYLKVVANIQRTWDFSDDSYSIDKIFVHPNFNAETEENDIGLLHTDSPIVFNDRVQPIAISALFLTNQNGILSGFNLDDGNVYAPRTSSSQNVISNVECQQILGSLNGALIFEAKACILPTVEDQAVCVNDNGSPFVINGELAGISSWNVPCAQNSPIVVERIGHHLDFIQSQMNLNSLP